MRQQPSSFWLSVFLLLLLIPIHSYSRPQGQAIQFPNGKTIHAEVVDTPEARKRGLMFRDHLPEGGGMLFIFEEARPYRFWMKNCKFPIDIVWLNRKKEIIHLSEDTPPCQSDPCPTYGPQNKAALYVLELAAGFSKKEALTLGTVLQF
ncbi:DUF192 domain-containing protein [Nitrospira defluvii]|nr:DUF192 domain-containing protein [Nitrospira defluvii]